MGTEEEPLAPDDPGVRAARGGREHHRGALATPTATTHVGGSSYSSTTTTSTLTGRVTR